MAGVTGTLWNFTMGLMERNNYATVLTPLIQKLDQFAVKQPKQSCDTAGESEKLATVLRVRRPE